MGTRPAGRRLARLSSPAVVAGMTFALGAWWQSSDSDVHEAPVLSSATVEQVVSAEVAGFLASLAGEVPVAPFAYSDQAAEWTAHARAISAWAEDLDRVANEDPWVRAQVVEGPEDRGTNSARVRVNALWFYCHAQQPVCGANEHESGAEAVEVDFVFVDGGWHIDHLEPAEPRHVDSWPFFWRCYSVGAKWADCPASS